MTDSIPHSQTSSRISQSSTSTDAMNSSSSRSQVKPQRPLGIGIDFGTSNSAAALFDGQKVRMVQLEADATVMPSATYVDTAFSIVTGQDAIDSYIAGNTGRTVELSAEILGEGRSTTGQIGDGGLPEEGSTETVYGQSFVDGGQTGRLFRGIKRLLGSSNSQRLMVFNRAFRLVALITPLLVRIKKSVDAQSRFVESPRTEHACIGHPVNFEGQKADRNTTALDMLSEAYGYAEFNEKSYYPEPIAAALSYLHDNPSEKKDRLLAVDFGGGTLDLCVLQYHDGDYQVKATHGIGLGGDHIDQLLFKALLFPLLGKGERWQRSGEDREIETLFPFEQYEDLLLNWAVSYMLNQNQYTTPILQRMEQQDSGAVKYRRLYDLIKNNYSYLVFQSIKDLKAALSDQTEARLDIPELDIELTVTRAQFESIITDAVDDFQEAIDKVLENAELETQDIDLVIRTGGSSLIPIIKQNLNSVFPGKVVEHNPFTSVAAGLAIAEYYGLGSGKF
ncbi:MAG: Hsp70 family protein [Pseudohongiellaceae bacterium]